MAQDWLGSFAGGRRFCARDRTRARSHPCARSVGDLWSQCQMGGGSRSSYLPILPSSTVHSHRLERGAAAGHRWRISDCNVQASGAWWRFVLSEFIGLFNTFNFIFGLALGGWGSHLGPRPLSRLLDRTSASCVLLVLHRIHRDQSCSCRTRGGGYQDATRAVCNRVCTALLPS